MTHFETARVREMLGLQLGAVRQAAGRLQDDDLERLEATVGELEEAVKKLREMLVSLPHRA